MSVTGVALVLRRGASSSWGTAATGAGGAGRAAAGNPTAACRAARTGRRTARSPPVSGSTRPRWLWSYLLLCSFLSFSSRPS